MKDKKGFYSWKYLPIIFITHAIITVGTIYIICLRFTKLWDIKLTYEFSDIQKVAEVLRYYLEYDFFPILTIEILGFYFLQTWCIPGTIIFNLLGGALFGMKLGFPLCLFINTIGAFSCYMWSLVFGKELVESEKLRPRVQQAKNMIEGNKDNLFFYMTFLRIFPGSPNWVMNVTFPHFGVPKLAFIASVAIGLLPWNFITCQTGMILSNIKSRADIVNRETNIQLAIVASVFLLPPICKALYSKFSQKKKIS